MNTNQELVVLLHGIMRTGRQMKKLENVLRKNGYEVLNITYPSRRLLIEQLAEFVHQELVKRRAFSYKTLHFVGFSMGGLLIRAYLFQHPAANLGRVVMLATPNKGSEIADRVQSWRLYKFLTGPAGGQLITDQNEFSFKDYQLPCDVGILAGNLCLELFFSHYLPKPNDGKVTVENTKLEGMKDHKVIRASHEFFPQNREVIRQTLHFLKSGNFSR
jgi:pimeloyl-ACP methyl ester carboxylesterase